MSLEFPQQERAIDPYSSYNSNVVNRLTRLITRGTNCLHGTHAIDVYLDPVSPLTNLIVSQGQAFKDDVLIELTNDHNVDMSNSDFYINHLNPWNESGYYYVCLEYTYAKAKPAPEAKIRILKPSQTTFYDPNTSAFLLLKVIKVVHNVGTGLFEIESLHDVHPENPDIKRIYAQLYAGVEDDLPEFDQARDEGRIIYCRSQDELYFGTSGAWESFSAIRANIDTTDCSVGQLSYIGNDGKVHPAIASGIDTLADCGVIQVGAGSNGDGKVRLYGILKGVPVEPGRTIQWGENVYLSSVSPGAVSDLINPSYPQFVGTSITEGDSTDVVDIWFLPTGHGSGGSGNSWEDMYQDLLDGSIFQNITVEPFINTTNVDMVNTTAEIRTSDFSLIGDSGEVFLSNSLQSGDYTGPRIDCCQISANVDSTSALNFYISNEGGEINSWELVTPDRIHNFSTYKLLITNITNLVVIGENIKSLVSNKVSTIVGHNGNYILVNGDTRVGYDFIVGEQIESLDSPMTATVVEVVNRQTMTSFYDLRVKIVFDGPGRVEDFGVLYNRDEDIFNEQLNIEALLNTLFMDVYKFPELVDDGEPRFDKSIQEQIEDVYTYIDSADATAAMELQYLDLDVQTLYKDLYISPTMDGDGAPNLITPIEAQIAALNDAFSDLTTLTTGASTTLNHDIDTLFADIYKTPSRDEDGLPNLTMNLEERIERREGSIVNISVETSTLSVNGKTTTIVLGATGVYTVTAITDAVAGQEIVLIFMASNTTIECNLNIRLMGGDSFTGTINDTLTLVYSGSVWVEKCRSLNS